MKILKVIVALVIVSIFASCSKDDSGIEYTVINMEDLTADAGETITLQINFSDDNGISQIVLESAELGIDYLENLAVESTSVNRDFELTVPSDAMSEEVYSIDIEVSDITGRRIQETIDLIVI